MVWPAERDGLGKPRRRGLGGLGAPGLSTPKPDVLLENPVLLVREADQHDSDIVQAERSFRNALGRLLLEGKIEPERTAFADRAFQSDLAAHHLDQLLRDRRTQACASVPPRRRIVRLSKAL